MIGMKKSTRLGPILRITQRQHQEQEASLARQLQAQNSAESQMDVLINFRQEYSNGLQRQSRLHVSQLQNHRGFIQQIDVAIQQQEQKVSELAGKTRQEQLAWQQSLNRRDGLEKLIDKRRSEEQRIAQKREQSTTDDLAHRLQLAE